MHKIKLTDNIIVSIKNNKEFYSKIGLMGFSYDLIINNLYCLFVINKGLNTDIEYYKITHSENRIIQCDNNIKELKTYINDYTTSSFDNFLYSIRLIYIAEVKRNKQSKIDMQNKLLNQTITDRQAIMKALSMPTTLPIDWPIENLIPIGTAKFKGGNSIFAMNANNYFTKDVLYPVYSYEGVNFAIGNDGIGKKITHMSWTKIKQWGNVR